MRGGSLPFARFLVEVNPVGRVCPERHRGRVPVGPQRPGELLIAEVLRNGDREHAVLPARVEVRRLSKVRAARLDPIVGTDGNVERLRLVPVEIADNEHATAVPGRPPAFEGRKNRLAGLAERLQQDALRRRGSLLTRHPCDGQRDEDRRDGEAVRAHDGPYRCGRSALVVVVRPSASRRAFTSAR